METQTLNLFIVDDNKSMVVALKHYIQNKFGKGVNISTFYDGESCIKEVNKNTDLVILDYFLDGKNGLDVLKEIKEKSPKTEVVILSSNNDLDLVIESLKNGATDYVVKGPSSWKRLTTLINQIVTAPIRLIVREFHVSKFMAIFFMTFATMAVVVLFVLYLLSK